MAARNEIYAQLYDVKMYKLGKPVKNVSYGAADTLCFLPDVLKTLKILKVPS